MSAVVLDSNVVDRSNRESIGPATIFQYLLGRREAILRIAAGRGTLLVGLLLVLSAGLAREYDGEDLLRDPWYLGIPVVASLATSFVLYLLVYLTARRRGVAKGNFWRLYGSFLALYWFTAPLAWLYAFPVERLFAAGNAARLNLLLLAIVATWRVVLITKGVSALFRAPMLDAFFLVMFFADSLLLAALVAMPVPLPVMSIMAGVRPSEAQMVVAMWSLLAGLLGGVTWLVWLIGAMRTMEKKEPRWEVAIDLPGAAPTSFAESNEATSAAPAPRASLLLWMFAFAAVAIWGLILPITQPEQQRRHEAETLLRSGDVAAAVEFMSTHEQRDFPPSWDPPPQFIDQQQDDETGEDRFDNDSQDHPQLLDVLEAIVERPSTAPWVREIYSEKFSNWLFLWWFYPTTKENDDRVIALLEQLPECRKFVEQDVRNQIDRMQFELNPPVEYDGVRFTPEQRRRLIRLIRFAEERGNPP